MLPAFQVHLQDNMHLRQSLPDIHLQKVLSPYRKWLYGYIIDPAVAMSGCFAARDRIKSEYGIVKDVRENSRGFYVVVDFDEEDVH